jgi:hypothetical protein
MCGKSPIGRDDTMHGSHEHRPVMHLTPSASGKWAGWEVNGKG